MPELPEVETVRRGLETLIVDRTIRSVDVHLDRIVRTPDVPEFCARLTGQTIRGVGRRGKYLLIALDTDVLVSHLRMEGRYGFYGSGDPVEAHTHIVFQFVGHTELRYRDVRQFGTMDLLAHTEYHLLPGLRDLGVEPLEDDFDGRYLLAAFRSRRAPVKAVLLDQTVVAGLGNIYVDEALFRAGVHPERRAHTLSAGNASAIASAVREVISQAIEQGGSSVKSYVNGFGDPGGYQFALQVYGKKGQACANCGNPIVKGRVAGRGTHVCIHCQQPPRHATISRKSLTVLSRR
ncbi:MAG: DNA-formamidopyrimidine glycosylase [Bacilli bacterium]